MLRTTSTCLSTLLLQSLLHLQAFVPLFVIVVLQDVHLKMGVVLSAALCICLAVGNYWFHRMQVVKVRRRSSSSSSSSLQDSWIPTATCTLLIAYVRRCVPC